MGFQESSSKSRKEEASPGHRQRVVSRFTMDVNLRFSSKEEVQAMVMFHHNFHWYYVNDSCAKAQNEDAA